MSHIGNRGDHPPTRRQERGDGAERRHGINEVLKHVEEEHNVEALRLEILARRRTLDIADNHALTVRARHLGGLRIYLDAPDTATRVNESRRDIAGRAADV